MSNKSEIKLKRIDKKYNIYMDTEFENFQKKFCQHCAKNTTNSFGLSYCKKQPTIALNRLFKKENYPKQCMKFWSASTKCQKQYKKNSSKTFK